MPVTGTQIVECARSYVGTPFAHAGRCKGKASDCVGLPLMIAGELGLADRAGLLLTGATYTAYSAQPVNNIVLDMCAKHLVRVPNSARQPGDLLVMKVPTNPCHVGIYSGVVRGIPHMIHSYSGVGKCCEHAIDAKWARRIVAVYRYPEVSQWLD